MRFSMENRTAAMTVDQICRKDFVIQESFDRESVLIYETEHKKTPLLLAGKTGKRRKNIYYRKGKHGILFDRRPLL